METDPVVQLVDVVAVLDRFPALAGATLTVRRGEIVLLQGPNGAGKTTLLRLCAGLLPPARGTAMVLGLDLADQRQAVRSRVGLLGHSNGLYTDLTVDENVGVLGCDGRGVARTRSPQRSTGWVWRAASAPCPFASSRPVNGGVRRSRA